jgi:hypothetical protein
MTYVGPGQARGGVFLHRLFAALGSRKPGKCPALRSASYHACSANYHPLECELKFCGEFLGICRALASKFSFQSWNLFGLLTAGLPDALLATLGRAKFMVAAAVKAFCTKVKCQKKKAPRISPKT